MIDKSAAIDGIVQIMNSRWDLPPDCNDGELIAYAEVLFDKITAGDSREALYAYLAGIQSNKLDMPRSDAFKEIADRAFELVSAEK